MQRKTIIMLTADEGKALVKDGKYCRAVSLKEGDDGAGWSEVPIEEANAAIEAAKVEKAKTEAERRAARQQSRNGQGGAQ